MRSYSCTTNMQKWLMWPVGLFFCFFLFFVFVFFWVMYRYLSSSSEDTRYISSGLAQLILVEVPYKAHAGIIACAGPPPVHGQCEDFIRQGYPKPDYFCVCPCKDLGTIRVVPVCLANVHGGRSSSLRISQLTSPQCRPRPHMGTSHGRYGSVRRMKFRSKFHPCTGQCVHSTLMSVGVRNKVHQTLNIFPALSCSLLIVACHPLML